MKRLIIAVLMFMCLFASTTVYAIDVYVLSGQSNMIKAGKTSELSSELISVPSNVEFHYIKNIAYGITEDHVLTNFTEIEEFGVFLNFTHTIAQAFSDRKLLIIVYAVPNTSLLAWSPNWTATDAALTENNKNGPLYSKLVKAIGSITAGRTDLEYKAILWMQGEKDSAYQISADNYRTNLMKLVNALRVRFNSPFLPFVYGIISVNPQASLSVPYAKQVMYSQLDMAATPYFKAVPTANCELDMTGHYTTKGQLELGKRFAERTLEIVK